MQKLIFGDAVEELKNLPDSSVDMILTDPPYGTTACKWDIIIPFGAMWEQLKRIIKEDGVVVLFGSEPFSSFLRTSNIEDYKYDWMWVKTRSTGFTHTKNSPQKKHEVISVFSKGKIKHAGQPNRMQYNPQDLVEVNRVVNGDKSCSADRGGHRLARPSNKIYTQQYTNYPNSVLEFPSEGKPIHPTQKPIELMEYLIKTYSS